ncbi:uncharacterized mitochondrial protein AtMg00860-like [Carya illinoinensis]|uniref:uncharacterized mitochondrial protein AtMg00860-like n=1 Tax=Carya illinoinensis TaxID=32201 RepID=UPI001C7254AE|nr:uncharacterized mitochondrial protein AtMg00860-like [Carya illinoinensis]
MYRLSPKESEELQHQVVELLERGYIHESLSLCAVLALLVPKKDGYWHICIDNRAINRIMPPDPNPTWESYLDHLRAIFEMLRKECLFINQKKCYFFTNFVTFLSFVLSTDGVHANQSKVYATLEWPTPKTLHDIRSFNRLASLYCRFIRNFSILITPITECFKGRAFQWFKEAEASF